MPTLYSTPTACVLAIVLAILQLVMMVCSLVVVVVVVVDVGLAYVAIGFWKCQVRICS